MSINNSLKGTNLNVQCEWEGYSIESSVVLSLHVCVCVFLSVCVGVWRNNTDKENMDKKEERERDRKKVRRAAKMPIRLVLRCFACKVHPSERR